MTEYMKKKPEIFKKLETLASLVPTAFYWVDIDTTILGGNDIAIDMIKEFSPSCKEVIGKNAFDMFPPDAAKELIKNNKKAVKARSPLFFEETVTDIKTNKKRFRNVVRAPLYDGGKVVGISILVNDVTKVKEKTILELKKQLQFKTLVDQTAYEFKSPLAILLLLVHQCSGRPKDVVFDILSKLTAITPTLLYWFDENNVLLISNKWDSEAVGGNFVSKTPYDYFPFEIANALVKNNKLVMKTGKILSYDEQLKNALTGEMNYYRAFKAPLYDDEGKSIGVLGTSINVTTEKNAERLQLENALQKVRLKEQEKYEMMVTQLAHDIRSPTSSLSMILDTCKNIPERERVTLISAANRITDIANNLLNSYKKNICIEDVNVDKQQPILVSLLLSGIVSERRKCYVESSVEIKKCYEPGSEFLFTKSNLLNFERMISNLLNNSFEAIESKQGVIKITLGKKEDKIKIIIEDDGKGMSKEVVNKIMNKVIVTSGKRGGTGIGLSQVRESLKESKGEMSIDSVYGKGTKITLYFPMISSPDWIARQICLPEKALVVVVDDDPSVHGAWDLRFKNYSNRIKIEHFKSSKKAVDFINSFPEKSNLFLLVDFEFIDQDMDGLQVIEKTGLIDRSILVTSYYNKQKILDMVSGNGVKVLPKQLASAIPIKFDKKEGVNNTENTDLVIVDDNKIFADSLSMFFESRSFKVDVYYSPKGLLGDLTKHSHKTKFFIDNEFCNDDMSGVGLIEKLRKAGYKDLYLLSGRDFKKEQLPSYINVITKGNLDELNKLI